MFYRCKEFKVKDASGAEVNIETISDSSEVLIRVNELRGTITVYPNITVGKGYSKVVTVNQTPVYIISGGSLEITKGEAYKADWVTFTSDPYPEEEGDAS